MSRFQSITDQIKLIQIGEFDSNVPSFSFCMNLNMHSQGATKGLLKFFNIGIAVVGGCVVAS